MVIVSIYINQASVNDVMEEIITPGAAQLALEKENKKKEAKMMKKPSSANRRYDREDEAGEDRTGESRDAQKARSS